MIVNNRDKIAVASGVFIGAPATLIGNGGVISRLCLVLLLTGVQGTGVLIHFVTL